MLKAPNALILNSLFQEKVKSSIIRQQVRRGKKVENEKKKEEIKKVVYVLSRYVCIHQILFFSKRKLFFLFLFLFIPQLLYYYPDDFVCICIVCGILSSV